jgi:catalase
MQGVPERIVRREVVHFGKADPAHGSGAAKAPGLEIAQPMTA